MKLSICIATYNRGKFIGETLDSIIPQMKSNVELVVVDGASPDDTSEVMAEYLMKTPQIRYFREMVNSGVDADFDRAVEYARGEYCWLMTDDDLLMAGAVDKVLSMLNDLNDLVIINAEVRDIYLKTVLESRRLNVFQDITYQSSENEEFFVKCMNYLSFIGCVIIRRSVWMERDRASYYGSLFVHVGVIFQKRLVNAVQVVSDPLIILRYGNAMWTPRACEIWMFKWPNLVWSFPELPDEAKNTVSPESGLRKIKLLFHQRALGGYAHSDFDRLLKERLYGWTRVAALLISLFPAKSAHFASVVFLFMLGSPNKLTMYDLLRSRNSSWLSRRFMRFFAK
jgi:abequosyltransferase